MGTYLSTPVVSKGQEEGECFKKNAFPCAWGVVDMQGWRKSMEDSHVARTDVELADSSDDDARLFGVFDGHGGPEVARFCALYLVSVFQKHYKGDAGQALKETFHTLDRMIDDANRREELMRLRAIAPEPGEQRDSHLEDLPQTPTQKEKATRSVTPEASSDTKEKSNSDLKATVTDTEDCSTTEKSEGITPAVTSTESESDDEEDADSVEAAGKDEAAENDQDLSSDEEDEADTDDPSGDVVPGGASHSSATPEETPKIALDSKAAKVSSMFQRLLNLKGSSGEIVLQVGQNGVVATPRAKSSSAVSTTPTVIRNGQILICNLPDHPVHAGATAIVAVMIGRTLTVANAGDSRAVICRAGGVTQPLSFDHKPTQSTEMSRIRTAGGFVNAFGRVNGNLNLSRSIGDLKYKQNPELSPAQQMITAEPDILEITLEPDDEFIILGCDGIWDCLTNEKAVEFVRTRINDKKLTEIGAEMLDTIISDDPRSTQGIGGDNMTVMIIDLQPLSRSYRCPADSSPVENNEPPTVAVTVPSSL